MELTNGIKGRIALRRCQNEILEGARKKLGFKGGWTDLVANHPSLAEDSFVDAYTKIYLKHPRANRQPPPGFTEHLNQRLDLIITGKLSMVPSYLFSNVIVGRSPKW